MTTRVSTERARELLGGDLQRLAAVAGERGLIVVVESALRDLLDAREALDAAGEMHLADCRRVAEVTAAVRAYLAAVVVHAAAQQEWDDIHRDDRDATGYEENFPRVVAARLASGQALVAARDHLDALLAGCP